MKVLLTGASGMVGKNISELTPSYIQLLKPDSMELDLLDFDKTDLYLKIHKPDLIIHAAGIVGGIQANINNPVKFLRENTLIGHNLIWSSHLNSIKSLINLGSSCMYPKDSDIPLKEDSILTGQLEATNEGYAIAKIFSQRLCSYINMENGFKNYKTIIPCNLYGKYDKFDPTWAHLIPSVINKVYNAKLNEAKYVTIWGDGSARREFMFATDFARFIWFAVSNLDKIPELINVGLGYDYSINEYYEIIAKIIGYTGKFKHDLSKPTGMKRKQVDIAELRKIGWSNLYTLEQGIEQTLKYFKDEII